MALTRRVARPMLASVFIFGGVETLRNPEPRVQKAEPVTQQLAQSGAPIPDDPEQLVKVNAAVQVVAGTLLAIGRFRRLAAGTLLVSLVPTTVAGHRFWELDEPAPRAQQMTHFFKNVGLAGGLLLAAFDTEGAPGLGWRARRMARRAGQMAHVAADVAHDVLPHHSD